MISVRSQYWMVKTIVRIVTAPWKTVVFRDFFIADQLCSLVIVLYDLQFVLCFFSYDAWEGTGNIMKLR